MSDKFVSFLEDIGKDFENGLAKLEPIVAKGVAVAQVAVPFVTAVDPAIGVLFATTVATVSTIEQKFAAMSAQTGTGTQKLAQAIGTIGPMVAQVFSATGRPTDSATITNYVNAIVGFLNALPPASTAPPAPGPTPNPSNL